MTPPALLVVDDSDDDRHTLTRLLAREGYGDVATADDGRQALARLQGFLKPVPAVNVLGLKA